MKPWPIKLVRQKGKTCAIACLAMILGVEFDEVEKRFGSPDDMTLVKVSNFLGDHGYSILIKESVFHGDPNFGREIISTPFAPVHIVRCKQFADDMAQHVVVMDQKGKILDPDGGNGALDDYFMLTGVLGIWRPKDLLDIAQSKNKYSSSVLDYVKINTTGNFPNQKGDKK